MGVVESGLDRVSLGIVGLRYHTGSPIAPGGGVVQLLRGDGSPADPFDSISPSSAAAPRVVPVVHELAAAPSFLSRSPGILPDGLGAPLASLAVATVTTIELDVPCRWHPT